MIPQKSLIQPPRGSAFIFPDNLISTNLVDYELGGIGLSDASQGLQVQEWTLQVVGLGINTSIQVSSSNTPPTILFSLPNITWGRLAFDQNMHPVICYVDQTGPGFWWYDPTIPGQIFTSLSSDVQTPCCSMDDKRSLEIRLGTNDVIISYIRANGLFYRQQRDRYGIEYSLYPNLNLIIPNPNLNKIGMGVNYRLQFEIYGSLYQ